MTKKYLIANLYMEITFDSDEVLEKRLSEYETESESCDIRINVSRTSDDIEVKDNNLIKLSEITYLYKTESADIIYYHDPKLSKVFAVLEFSKDYTDVEIKLYTLKKNHNIEDNMLLFNIMGNVMSYVSQMHKGFVFHSSSVCYDGCGVAFSAQSGTGKSTHTALWLKEYPGSFILNDDTPVIRQGKDGEFYIFGTPWAGTTGINQNFAVPLKAIVFLERDKDNSISLLKTSEAIKPFFEAIRTPITDDMFSNCLETLNELFKKVRVCLLKCNMDSSAAYTSKEFIFGK